MNIAQCQLPVHSGLQCKLLVSTGTGILSLVPWVHVNFIDLNLSIRSGTTMHYFQHLISKSTGHMVILQYLHYPAFKLKAEFPDKGDF